MQGNEGPRAPKLQETLASRVVSENGAPINGAPLATHQAHPILALSNRVPTDTGGGHGGILKEGPRNHLRITEGSFSQQWEARLRGGGGGGGPGRGLNLGEAAQGLREALCAGEPQPYLEQEPMGGEEEGQVPDSLFAIGGGYRKIYGGGWEARRAMVSWS